MRLPLELGVPFDYTVHDFFAGQSAVSILPTTRMASFAVFQMNLSVERTVDRPNQWGMDIVSSRFVFAELFADARRIFCPSRFVMEVMKDFAPEANLVFKPHPEIESLLLDRSRSKPLELRWRF